MCKGNAWWLLVWLTVPVLACGQSLINADAYRSLTGDRRGHHVGETLTVLVIESTSAESSAGTGADSQTNIRGSATTDSNSYQVGLGLQGDTNGEGQTSRRGQVRANVSVRIVEELPEGLLRVSGEQMLTVNDEQQQIRVSGLVRPDDISYDNTVLSFRLADAQIDIIGDGVVTDAQKQNIIFKFLKWLRIL
ncbi:flagellar basal body L-ring protein FlgH [Pseudomonas anguilliseptica]|uniref:flagellar basal body L-ring protein FlgH n=1 Tax=Pseudomonas anguilliseptica TaxID=53406 RepID=UPI0022AF2FB2|nr:flagellar basal body L-ring protein FlgH [Pseudomonas anguilliseptica]MCZ4324649.1 flagellar basal body L-ring protein FlgH [Pseudomonas anguilliseptica]